ncbi:MAG TPA: hypothetical protein VFX50_10310, partial [Gemmatimonadales bacterium]|nr:hypothetical protein [Gemmatimonadales bacterium]
MQTAPRVVIPEPTLRMPESFGAAEPRARLGLLAAVALGTALVFWLTAPETTADAPDYARDIVTAQTAGWRPLVEPGHLAWRPLGHAITEVLGLPAGADPQEQIRVTQGRMTVVASVAGVLAAVGLAMLTWHLVPVAWGGVAAALLFALSSSFISYAQAGTSYIPGLACLVFGLVAGWDPRARPSLARGVLGGALVALGVLFWLPYVLVVPAALLGWLVWRPEGRTRSGLAEAAAAVGSCAVVGLASYLGAAAATGVRDVAGFLAWLGGTSHGVTTGGLQRAVLGFPRSFLYMGHDGREVKRFLLHDPLNVVTRADVLRLGLWPRMAAFYVGGLAMLLLAWRGARRWLLLLAVAALPTLALAV